MQRQSAHLSLKHQPQARCLPHNSTSRRRSAYLTAAPAAGEVPAHLTPPTKKAPRRELFSNKPQGRRSHARCKARPRRRTERSGSYVSTEPPEATPQMAWIRRPPLSSPCRPSPCHPSHHQLVLMPWLRGCR